MEQSIKCFMAIAIATIFVFSGFMAVASLNANENQIGTDQQDGQKAYICKPSPLPNLKAMDIWTVPNPPLDGISTVIYFKIANINPTSTTRLFGTMLSIDNSNVSQNDKNGLAGNSEYTFSYTCVLAAGNHQLKIVVDYTNVVVEPAAYENGGLLDDNILTKSITWQVPMPDVEAVDIWTHPIAPLGNSPTYIYYKISTNSIPFTATVYTDV